MHLYLKLTCAFHFPIINCMNHKKSSSIFDFEIENKKFSALMLLIFIRIWCLFTKILFWENSIDGIGYWIEWDAPRKQYKYGDENFVATTISTTVHDEYYYKNYYLRFRSSYGTKILKYYYLNEQFTKINFHFFSDFPRWRLNWSTEPTTTRRIFKWQSTTSTSTSTCCRTRRRISISRWTS